MKTTKFIIICLTGSLLSCNNTPEPAEKEAAEVSYSKLEQAGWILGSWQNSSPEGIATENWKMDNDSTYSGSSYFVMNQDTVSSEKLTLEQRGEDLFYIPTVKDQN